MPSTCLLCCEEEQIFLMPPCNHKEMCWKCCLKLIQGSTFSCPFCKGTPEGKSCILFVTEQQMRDLNFQQIFKIGAFRSSLKSYQYYSNENVAKYIQEQTSFFCRLCFQVFNNINSLKKHLYEIHKRQYCDVCMENRKCLISEQYLFTQGELMSHQKKGQFSEDGQLMLYHPLCQFCKIRYYDTDAFKAHLRMSSHLKCHICQINYPDLRYVYYRNIDEIQQHFKKSHFMCEHNTCIGLKFENVFVSETALEQHTNKIHNKYKGKHGGQVMNLLLFQPNQQDEQLQWDRIGKNLSSQFKRNDKNYQLVKQDHINGFIDIRQFYPQKVKVDNKQSVKDIEKRLYQHLYRPQFRSTQVSLASIPLFTPMSPDCPNLQKYELQKLLKTFYQPKLAEQIILTFFKKKYDFKSLLDYFLDIRRKMCVFSRISYYYLFPQLIRFLRDDNTSKKAMDEFYADSLRQLKRNKQFVFHKKQTYTDIFQLIQEQIEGYIYDQLYQERIDLNLYKKYVKDMNASLYAQNQKNIFFVQKDRMINLYHMIQKCKTKQLPKLSWLLKIGFSQQSYRTMYRQFFYKQLSQCKSYITSITIQQIALLYAYCTISIEALTAKDRFKFGKQHTQPLFFSSVLCRIPPVIENKQKILIQNLQRKSLDIISINTTHKNKGLIVNQYDHPSLLSPYDNNETNNNDFPILSINAQVKVTKANPKKRKNNTKNIENNNFQQYPSLMGASKMTAKQQMNDEQQFPVFNYQQKYIDTKNRDKYKKQAQKQDKIKARSKKYQQLYHQDSKDNPDNIVGISQDAKQFGLFNKTYKTKFKEDNNQQKQQQNINNANREWDMPTIGQVHQKQTPKQQPQNLGKKKKKKKIQQAQQNQKQLDMTNNSLNFADQFGEDVVILKKKAKNQLEQQDSNTKQKKGKNKKKNQDNTANINDDNTQRNKQSKKMGNHSKIKQEEGGGDDFPALGIPVPKKQQVKVQPVKDRKLKPRLDMSDSDDQAKHKQQARKQYEQKKRKIAEQQQKKRRDLDPNGFQSLISSNKVEESIYIPKDSIVNQIIKNSQVQVKQPEKIIKKGKKGKAVLIERVDLRKL